MCFSSSFTAKNTDLSKKYGKKIPEKMDDSPIYYASGFSFPTWKIVTNDDTIQEMNWGLVPFWFKGDDYKDIASKTLNARIETVDSKPSYRHLLQRHECIVPFTGFYEWQTNGKNKIPYFVYPAQGNIFSVAGLYDNWLDLSTGNEKKTFTILTGPANELMAEIHNTKKRMPVLLKPEQEKDWLNGEIDLEILKNPVDSSFLIAHQVDHKLITGKHRNVPQVMLPFKNQEGEQTSLF